MKDICLFDTMIFQQIYKLKAKNKGKGLKKSKI